MDQSQLTCSDYTPWPGFAADDICFDEFGLPGRASTFAITHLDTRPSSSHAVEHSDVWPCHHVTPPCYASPRTLDLVAATLRRTPVCPPPMSAMLAVLCLVAAISPVSEAPDADGDGLSTLIAVSRAAATECWRARHFNCRRSNGAKEHNTTGSAARARRRFTVRTAQSHHTRRRSAKAPADGES